MSNLCEGASIDGSVVGHVCSGSKNQSLYSDTVCSLVVIIPLCIV